MKRISLFLCVVAVLLCANTSVVAGEAHLMRYADIHWDWVVFTYEGDLWLVPSVGGDARRITRHPGLERYAKFSPDGSKIAFTGSYDGGTDVYVMDARGGVPQRLTYHPASDRVLGWTVDGSSVLFRSRRAYPFNADRLYTVSADGGMPTAVPVDRAGLASFSPDGSRLAYNRISREARTWKRHQGGTAQDLWMGSLADGDFRRITEWEGTDNYPMWHGEAIYFVSDRVHGTLNLCRYDLATGEVSQLTENQDYDLKYPSLGPGAIIYQYGETLHRYDLRSGDSRKIEIRLGSDRVPTRAEYVKAGQHTGAFRLAPEGDRLFLEARGEILGLPVEEGDAVNLSARSASREKNVVVSPDGESIAFFSDRSGEEELWLMAADGSGEWRQLTSGGAGFRLQPVWSPNGENLLFSDKAMALNLVQVESGQVQVIDRGEWDDAWERWGIQDYGFSPDSRWIVYTKQLRSLNEAIFVYDLENKQKTRLTGDETNDWSPSFSACGSYLYFLSNRTFQPVMGVFDQNHVFLDAARPYVMILRDGEPSPFAPGDAAEDEEEAEDPPKVTIDVDGIDRRVLAAEGVEAGNYFRLEATASGFLYLAQEEKVFLKYQAVSDRSSERLKLYLYDLAEQEASEVMDGINNYHLSADGKKMVYRKGGTFGVVDTGAEAKVGDGKIDLAGVKLKVDRMAEFLQIFNEAWRVQRDWFYDPGMHGVDWQAVGEKYRRFVASCGNRADLNYLIGELIGELNAGHTYIFGGEMGSGGSRIPVGLLGADFDLPENAKHHRIKHIVRGKNWHPDERSPLEEPGCAVVDGDYLITLDGAEVLAADNVYAFLEDKVGKRVELGFASSDSGADPESCQVTPLRSERSLRYREWVEANRAKVAEASDGKIAYMHLPAMMDNGVIEFARAFYHDYYKKAFIIDDRYNAGGFVGDQIIDRLERRVWGMTKPREGGVLTDPERCFHGHLVVLVNEDTGSNGEYFAEAIQIKGLAPVLGKRTWGGAVGIEPHQDLVDGAVTTPPQFAPYSIDGRRWLIEGRGVEPDIEVDNMPADVLAGRDPQLEAAIDLMLKKLELEPKELAGPPDFPIKKK